MGKKVAWARAADARPIRTRPAKRERSSLDPHSLIWPDCPRCNGETHDREVCPHTTPHQEEARRWGFTQARWAGSLLQRDGDRVLCWILHARKQGRGYFRALMHAIEQDGLRVAVPVPMKHMKSILRHYGFVMHTERNSLADKDDPVEVWEKPNGSVRTCTPTANQARV